MTLNGRKSSRKELEAALVMLKLEVLDLNARLGHALSVFDCEIDMAMGQVTPWELERFMKFLKKKASTLPESKQPENSSRELQRTH